MIEIPDKFSVKVEQRHIDDGRRRNCFACPIALAANDLFKGTWQVAPDRASVWYGSRKYNFAHDGRGFIKWFDNSLPVYPCVINFERVK